MSLVLNRYRRTIPLTGKVLEYITSGRLVLQRGQWVRCSTGGRPSRFFGLSRGGVIYAAHYPHHHRQFQSWVQAERGTA